MLETLFALTYPEISSALESWLLRTTVAGGVVLCLGSLWMVFTHHPSRRQRIGELALLAALLVALPAALPAWWSITNSTERSASERVIFGSKPVSLPDATEGDKRKSDLQVIGIVEDPVLEIEAEELGLLQVLEFERQIQLVEESSCSGGCHDKDTHGAVLNPIAQQANWSRWALRCLAVVYLSMVIILLVRCFVGYYGLWRYWRLRSPAPAHVCAALAELEPEIRRRPRIGVNRNIPGPVSYGLWKPTILLPPSFCHEGDPEKLRWILAHELTHLRRRDAWSCLLLAVGGAVYFHLPWFWWMKRHVRLAQEYLADAAAVRLSSAVEYAQYLVSLTTLANRPTLASSRAAGVFESPSDLYRRVDMLLHHRCALEHRAPRWWTVTVASSFFTLAACTSGIQLYAEDDRPAKTVQVVVQATDDKENSNDQTVTLKATGVVALEDNDQKKKPDEKKGTIYRLQADQQQKVAEALKKLDAALNKLPQQLDPETRKQLEDLKQSLQELKEKSNIWLMRSPENLQEWRIRLKDETEKASEAAKKAAQEYRAKVEVKAKELAESVRAQADKAEEEARNSGEKIQKFWKQTRDGAGREAIIKDLEAAITEKEKALEELKKNLHLKEVAPLLLEKPQGFGADTFAQGRLGVVVAELDNSLRSHLNIPQDQGLIVTAVVSSGPAWNEGHGLQVADILLTFAGKKVPNNQEAFREIVRDLPADEVKAVVLRKGKKVNVEGIKIPNIDHQITKPMKLKMVIDPNKLLPQIEANRSLNMEYRRHPKVAPLGGVKLLNLEGTAKITDDKNPVAIPLEFRVAPSARVGKVDAPVLAYAEQGTKPRLGVVLEPVPEIVASQVELAEDRGLLVTEVVDGTPAQKAGIQKNDILIEFADKSVSRNHPEFSKFLKELKPGKYNATVIRKGKEIRIRDITIAEIKDDKAKAREWIVEGSEQEENQEQKEKKSDRKADKDDDFFPQARRGFNLNRMLGNNSITINNGKFNIRSEQDGKLITVQGKMVDGKPSADLITIKDSEEETTKKYKSLKEVPAEDKEKVEKLMGSIKANNFQFGNIRGNFNFEQFDKQFEAQMREFEKQMERFGEGGLQFELLEKQMEQLRKQLEQLRKIRPGRDDDQ